MLPRSIFKCSKTPDAASASAQSFMFKCSHDTKSSCLKHDDCEWCKNKLDTDVGSGCYTSGEANLLPEKVWSCTDDKAEAFVTEIEQEVTHNERAVGKPVIECSYDGEAKCIVHPNCQWCESKGKTKLGNGCYTSGEAKLLPEKLWSCTNDKVEASKDEIEQELTHNEQAVGKPVIECSYDGEAKCIVHPNCHWCESKGKTKLGNGCYTSGEAKLLPKKLWSCTGDVVEAAKEKVESVLEDTVSKPLIECHYDTRAKCVVHPDCEWCKTSSKAGVVFSFYG